MASTGYIPSKGLFLALHVFLLLFSISCQILKLRRYIKSRFLVSLEKLEDLRTHMTSA